jgi:hypothetical protein
MERAPLDGDLFLQKIAYALLVEPEELLEVSEGRLKGSESPKFQRPKSGNLRVLQASARRPNTVS